MPAPTRHPRPLPMRPLVCLGNALIAVMLSGGAAAAADAPAAVELQPLPVTAAVLDPTPAATASKDAAALADVPPTEPYDILTGIPGVFVQNDGSPGLAIAVRGLQDFGRVNVLLDGARQDFQFSGHGANSSVYVDPALLSGIDVARGTVGTEGGAGAIGGVVDLHTIGIQDVLAPGQGIGGKTTDIYGTNHYDGSGMVAAGVRVNPALDVMAAYSMRSSGDYADGAGVTVPDSYQRLQSGLIKLDAVPGAGQTLQLGAVFYHNDFGSDSQAVETHDAIESNTVTAKYHLAPAIAPMVDLHTNFYYVGTSLHDAVPEFQAVTLAPADTTHVRLTTLGGSVDNVSRIDLGEFAAAVTLGGEYVHDAVGTTDQTGDTGETPSGARSIGSAFAQGQLGWSLLQLTGNVRYDNYHLQGSGTNLTGGVTTAPAGPFDIDRSADAISPKVTLAARILPGASLYGSYSLGFRPPAITETLFSGAHPGLDFLRFVPNPDLSPERTHGWEAGARLAYRAVLLPNDNLHLNADYFDTRIRDYIAQTLVVGAPDPASQIPIPINAFFYHNTPGLTRTSGTELDASYTAPLLFARLAYTNTTTRLPGSDYTGFDAIITAPPRSVVDATLGLTLADQRLSLGARVRAATATIGQPSLETGTAASVPGYTVFDLFGSFAVTKAIRVFASAENLTDRRYFLDALATDPTPGRTVKLGITIALGR